MNNGHRWLIAIVLGFLGGLATTATNPTAKLGDYVRAGLIGVGPTIAALQMTLTTNNDAGKGTTATK